MPELYLKQLKLGPMENFVYLLGAKDSSEVAVIDPAWEPEQILAAAEADGKVITHLLVTHSHGDHVNAIAPLLEKTKAKVVAHREEVEFSEVLRGFKSELSPVRGCDVVNVGPLAVQCLHTPGHTPGSQCFHVDGALVSGDTLFINACGRCDLRGGDPEAMFRTLDTTLSRLPAETVLFPGHDYADVPTAPLSQVRASNPYLQVHDLSAFIALRMKPRG